MRAFERTEAPARKGPLTHIQNSICYRDGDRWTIYETRKNTRDLKRIGELESLIGSQAVFASLTPRGPNKVLLVDAYLDLDKGKQRAEDIWDRGIVLLGLFPADNHLPIWQVMLDAPKLQMDEKPEMIDGALTYHVKSDGPLGIHSCWLDPKAGCLPRKIEITKTKGHGLAAPPKLTPDQLRRSRLRVQPAPLVEHTQRYENITLGLAGETPVMMGYDTVGISKTSDGNAGMREEFRVKKLHINKNEWPEDALDQKIQIPDGTPVHVFDAPPGAQYEWRKGEMVKLE